jgi:putative PIN family toxin of toxin-antitoxin system
MPFAKNAIVNAIQRDLPRVLVDTNIFVSGVISGGKPSVIIDSWKSQLFTLATSISLIEERITVLRRPKIQEYSVITEYTIEELISIIYSFADMLKNVPSEAERTRVRDPNDAHVLDAALAGKVD